MSGPYGASNGPAWVGVLIFGIVLTMMGIMAFAFSSAMDDDPFFSDITRIQRTVGTVMLAFGVLIVAIGIWMGANKVGETPPTSPQEAAPQLAERRVVEEVIKIRCRYCGTLNGVNDKICSACGGPL